MNILIPDRIGEFNLYTKHLATAYQNIGHCVIYDVQNFLFSDFLPDFVHIQWPESIYRWEQKLPENKNTLVMLNDRLYRYSKAKIPIVYTVHNILPHENTTEFSKEFCKAILNYSDIIVHHGKSSITLLKDIFPDCRNKNHIVCPQGPYARITEDWQKSRFYYKLPLSKYIFLNFGLQRSYKGFKFTKKVFNKFQDPNFYLFTIGPKIAEKQKSSFFKIVRQVKCKIELRIAENTSVLFNNMKSILRSVPNDEIPKIMAAVDAFFLGHQDGLNSGLLSLAATYGKPIIFPMLGNFNEQLEGWLYKEPYIANNAQSATEALIKMRARLNNYSPGRIIFDNSEWLELHSWNKHVNNIVNAVEILKNKRICK